MPIQRDVKTLSKRLDASYFKQRNALRRVRVMLILLCCGAAVGWWGLAGGATDEALYNPGPVASVHASFGNNCISCHTGDGKGGFVKTVTDTACLKCHDGSIHNPNQKLDSPHQGGALSGSVLAVSDAKHPAGMRAGSCIACHTEHRGHTMLAATNDTLCVSCHANLKDAAKADPASPNRVVAFNATDHPDFGRDLVHDVDGAKRLVDPTVLQFNHRKHLGLEQFNTDASCVKCHTPDASGKYIQPIRFAQHCASCHAIEAPSVVNQIKRGPKVTNETLLAATPAPHESMETIRAYASAHVARSIAEKSFADARTQEEFVKKLTDKLVSNTGKTKLRDGAWQGSAMDAKAPSALAGLDGQRAMTDLYTQAIAIDAKGCVLCHTLEQKDGKLETVPTTIPQQPRRWFASSEFDHRAHRQMTCVSCHSTLSREKLDASKDVPSVPQMEQTSFLNSPATVASCVECHHSGTNAPKGVASDCVSCHNFHDRAKER